LTYNQEEFMRFVLSSGCVAALLGLLQVGLLHQYLLPQPIAVHLVVLALAAWLAIPVPAAATLVPVSVQP
jgi:hypothetical protein